MEAFLNFLTTYGWQLFLIAVAGVMILGILKYAGVFERLSEKIRHFLYLVISVGLSIIGSIAYLIATKTLTLELVCALALAIFGLNQLAYSVYDNTPLRSLLKTAWENIVAFFKSKFGKGKEEVTEDEWDEYPEEEIEEEEGEEVSDSIVEEDAIESPTATLSSEFPDATEAIEELKEAAFKMAMNIQTLDEIVLDEPADLYEDIPEENMLVIASWSGNLDEEEVTEDESIDSAEEGKVKVQLPKVKSNLIYNGTEQVAIASTAYYTVEGGSATEAGKYTATVTLTDPDNTEWATDFDGTISYRIAKAKYNMSDVKFNDVVAKYTGEVVTATVEGNLPDGVTYYTIGEKAIEVGTYAVRAVFKGDYKNYNRIKSMSATITIEE